MNLTEISITARKVILWMIAILIAYFIIKFVVDMGIAYYKATHPIPPPGPNHNFNKLPYPKFPSTKSTSGLNFTLETIDGKPPETTAAGKVYAMPKKLPTLLAAEQAKNFSKKLEFLSEPNQMSSTRYRYTDSSDNLRILDLDITYMNFKLYYDYLKNPEIFSMEQGVDKKQAENEVKNFIGMGNLFDDSILNGIITYTPLIFEKESSKFKPATSLSTANAIRVDYFRNNLDGMKILPPLFNKSFNYALYVPSLRLSKKIMELYYTFWPVAFDNFATYPLRSGAAAWQDLQDGYGSVVYNDTVQTDQIVIRNIYIAYYDSEESQNYLQPIFVFEGDNNFVAYLPAVTAEWLE